MTKRLDPVERFLKWVDTSGGNCWQWLSSTTRHPTHPYGLVQRDGKRQRAHRYAWELFNGPIPHGMLVCHTCDNTLCVRPEHLFLGTHRDNTQDMLRKGRHGTDRIHGETHHKAVLNDSLVREIRSAREAGESYGSLAERFGVSKGLTWQICTRRIWRHVA